MNLSVFSLNQISLSCVQMMAISNEQEISLLMVWGPVRLVHVHRCISTSPNFSVKGKQEYRNYHAESKTKNAILFYHCQYILYKKGEENLPSRVMGYCYGNTQALI